MSYDLSNAFTLPAGQSSPRFIADVAAGDLTQPLGTLTADRKTSALASLGMANAPQLKKWRAALAKVRAGTSNAKLLCVGDSTTAGYSSVTNTSVRLKSYPAQLATFLTGRGITAGSQSFWGTNLLPGGLAANDSRVTSSGWSAAPIGTPGGGITATSAATLAFTPAGSVDTFDIYYIGVGVFSAAIDAGGATNSTGSQVQKMTVTATAGTHTLNLAWVSGTAYVLGVDAYNSATKQVSVWNLGNYGSTSVGWAINSNAWDHSKIIPTNYQPDLSIICLGINDMGTGVPLATSQASLQTLISACQQTGDVILVNPVPSQVTAARPQTILDAYSTMLAGLATANGCAFVDLAGRFESYTVSNGLGFMADGLHPSSAGYCDKAQAFLHMISNV